MPTLHWIGKDKVINHHVEVPFKVLEHRYGFHGDNPDDQSETHSGNKIIHGDNLVALKALLPEYEGKIDCVYIDPPYNTGNEGWVYNDNVNDPHIRKWLGEVVGAEGEDLTRHDKWLCMMYPRLRLLQQLLSPRGVIFISIDDNELSNLRLICDEIFGMSNFIGIISWFKKSSPSNDAQYFSNDVEFILVYAKSKSIWRPNKLQLTEKQLKNYRNPDNDPRGAWNSATFTCNKSREERPNLYYPIINPNTGEEIFPKETAVWKFSRDVTEQYQKENLIFWGNDGSASMPRIKKFLSEHKGVVNRTLWHYDDVDHTQGAALELKKLKIKGFATPKPTRLIQRIIEIASQKDSIILDSFAGSGTTAHAVMKKNSEDGGKRKYILVELMDYAEDITAERVRRVIKGYGEGDKIVDGLGGSFDYYELGEPLFKDDGNLNENVGINKIRAYIYYSETHQYLNREQDLKYPYLLDYLDGTGYFFYYEPNEITTLSHDTLTIVPKSADHYVIYADICAISKEELAQKNITFKKIPRDINRF